MKKIFIDCGYNEGTVTSAFRNSLGSDFEFYAFEANPYLYEMFKNVNPFSKLENKAVWIENTTIPFYVVTVDRHGNRTSRTGASTLMESKAKWNMSVHKEQEIVNVEAIDFSNFIETNFSIDDQIIVKMDVEGAEYQILQKLLETGVINYINDLYVEFHDEKVTGVSKKEIMNRLNETNIRLHLWH